MSELLTLDRAKRRTAISMVMLVIGMTCLGFAAVPLYRMFCQVTGFGGTTQRAEAAALAGVMPVPGKTVSVRFDSNVDRLPWDFKPEQIRQVATIGEQEIAFFTAHNQDNKPVVGRAGFNVSPATAGQYFVKVECFCFTEQTLKAGENIRMPVLYYIDPKILDDPDTRNIKEITLSYTFHPVEGGSEKGR